MAVLKRLFGLPVSPLPSDDGCFTPGDGVVEVDLSRATELAAPGSALRLESADLPDRLLVVHGLDGTFRAYTNRCACAGWRIDPVPGEPKVRCCTTMQSTYDYDGTKLSGSARGDLETHPVDRVGDCLQIRIA